MRRCVVQTIASAKAYGGNIYEEQLGSYLRASFCDKYIQWRPLAGSGKIRTAAFLLVSAKRQRSLEEGTILIRGIIGGALVRPTTGIVDVTIVHHIDSSYSSLLSRGWQMLCNANFLSNASRESKVVVVSRFWEAFLRQRHFENVTCIENGFDIDKYEISNEAVDDFLRRMKLPTGRPIIYLGNPQRKKGAHIAYERLKHLDVECVTTGIGSLRLPVRNLQLSRPDFLCLLRASAVVVTLSQFLEGWCRVAHEAMLCGTPVIGSGLGGMGELLQGGRQLVCQDSKDLPDMVLSAIDRRASFGEQGMLYARQFTMERFQGKWLKLLNALKENGPYK